MKSQSTSKSPPVSIGMPVFNGQNYVNEAILSFLNQTFADFELVISDNASTDATQEICRSYAAQDARIRYYRSEINVGAAANYNRTFEFALGKYFKWAAHDDVCGPQFLARCVEVLERAPNTVLAFTKVMIIKDSTTEPVLTTGDFALASLNPAKRFADMVGGHRCFPIFGLIRRDALAKTPLMGGYSYGDGVLLARLALLGRFEEVPEYLFFSRQHPRQSDHLGADRRRYAIWFDKALERKLLFPWWRTQFEFFRSIHRAELSWPDKVYCYKSMYWSTLARRNLLLDDVTFQLRRLVSKFVV